MLSDIRQTFENLEKKTEKLRQHLVSLADDALYFKAGADKWSIVEAIEHLVVAEEDMITQLTGGASSPALDPRDRSAKNFYIVIKVMTKDIPVDVPDESLEPHGRFSLEELLIRWNAARQKAAAFIEAISDENAGNLVYRHPFAGPLDMAETLQFIDVHFDNHLRHLETIKARAESG